MPFRCAADATPVGWACPTDRSIRGVRPECISPLLSLLRIDMTARGKPRHFVRGSTGACFCVNFLVRSGSAPRVGNGPRVGIRDLGSSRHDGIADPEPISACGTAHRLRLKVQAGVVAHKSRSSVSHRFFLTDVRTCTAFTTATLVVSVVCWLRPNSTALTYRIRFSARRLRRTDAMGEGTCDRRFEQAANACSARRTHSVSSYTGAA